MQFCLTTSPTPVKNIRFHSYIGCFIDLVGGQRDLPHLAYYLRSINGRIDCVQACFSAGYQFAGTQSASECFCGNSYGVFGADPNGCNMQCTGNSAEICGGGSRNSVYRVWN